MALAPKGTGRVSSAATHAASPSSHREGCRSSGQEREALRKNLFTLPCPRGRLPEQRVPRCLLLDVLYLTWQWAVPWQYPICFPLFPGVMSAGSREGGRSSGASRRAEHHRAQLGLPTAAGDGEGTYTPLT